MFAACFVGLFLVCCLFMPITANWIWPRYGTPYEIIILIASMYISIVLGITCIKIYKHVNSHDSHSLTPNEQNEGRKVDGTFEIEVVPKTASRCRTESPSRKKLVILKYIHSILMIYSWVMLLGAGQAFLKNARTHGFPYHPGPITDSLVARCYGRDLAAMPGIETWLQNMTCGFASMCKRP